MQYVQPKAFLSRPHFIDPPAHIHARRRVGMLLLKRKEMRLCRERECGEEVVVEESEGE
ncbi:cell division trigger factor [Sesbania bispinosa]|nr:cell division trigger factor [Sesbania bispinosa]